MKERPILFSAPMVQALLAGQKMQTRRVVKPRKDLSFGCLLLPNELAGEVNNGSYENSPWSPGDRLWVREAWRSYASLDDIPPRAIAPCAGVQYEAGGSNLGLDHLEGMGKYRPSMFMPRWASRITLEVVSVRVELLQEISEADAIAEGAEWAACGAPQEGSYKAGYAKLWELLNGAGAWSENPWVWVVEFKTLKCS